MKNPIEANSHPEIVDRRFTNKDLEQSISSCFERQVRQSPHRLAVKTYKHQLTVPIAMLVASTLFSVLYLMARLSIPLGLKS